MLPLPLHPPSTTPTPVPVMRGPADALPPHFPFNVFHDLVRPGPSMVDPLPRQGPRAPPPPSWPSPFHTAAAGPPPSPQTAAAPPLVSLHPAAPAVPSSTARPPSGDGADHPSYATGGHPRSMAGPPTRLSISFFSSPSCAASAGTRACGLRWGGRASGSRRVSVRAGGSRACRRRWRVGRAVRGGSRGSAAAARAPARAAAPSRSGHWRRSPPPATLAAATSLPGAGRPPFPPWLVIPLARLPAGRQVGGLKGCSIPSFQRGCPTPEHPTQASSHPPHQPT